MPGLPLRQLPIHAFLGEGEGTTSLQLADVLSSGGSRNVWINALGKVTSIGGYTRVTPTPVFSDALDATNATSLHHYVSYGGVFPVRQEIATFNSGTAWEIKVSSDGGATWTTIGSFPEAAGVIPGAVSPSQTTQADYAGLGNLLVIAFGVGISAPIQFWDGVTLVNILQAQLAAPILALSGSAGQLEGNYKVRIVPMAGDRRKQGSHSSAVLQVNAGSAIGVTWTADPDPTVTAYEIYSTTGSGGVFYLAGNVAAGILAFTLNQDDLDLIQNRALAEHGDAPPETRYCEVHKARVFYGGLFNQTGFDASGQSRRKPRRWWFSDPGLADSVYQDRNFLDATDAESFSDITTGATGNFRDRLVIWLERSIWVASGTFEQIGAIIDVKFIRSAAKVGTVHHRTVARIPAGARYTDEFGNRQVTDAVTLAYLTPFGDIRLFDGSNDTIISVPKKRALDRLSNTFRWAAIATDDPSRGEVTWTFAAGTDAGGNNAAVTWNYRYGVWYDRPAWGHFSASVNAEAATDAKRLIAAENRASVGGLIYQLWDSTRADGEPFVSQWMSKTIYFPGMASGPTEMGTDGAALVTHQKRVRWADIVWESGSSAVSLLVEWLDAEARDDAAAIGSVVLAPPIDTLQTIDDFDILTLDGDFIGVARSPALQRARFEDANGRYFHGRGIRLRISHHEPD